MKTRYFGLFLLIALTILLLLGCALEAKKTASLNMSLPTSRGPNLRVHYLLHDEAESPNFYTPIDAAHAGSNPYGIVTSSSATYNYVVHLDAVEPKRYRLRVHAYAHSDPNMYYAGNNICGPWTVTDYDSIEYNFDLNGTYVFESTIAFDVVAGAAVDVNCNQIFS